MTKCEEVHSIRSRLERVKIFLRKNSLQCLFKTCPLVLEKLILLSDMWIFRSLARMNGLAEGLKKHQHFLICRFSSEQVKFGITLLDGQVGVNSSVIHSRCNRVIPD